MANNDSPSEGAPLKPATQQTLDSVIEALERVRYGAIQITIHEGRPVQVDVTERRRFP